MLVGQRIRFLGTDGDVLGVVGKKPIHLMKTEDRERASKITDLWVDIGATNRAEAEARVSVGDPGVMDSRSLDFPNDRIVSRSIDDRIGAFIVLEALRRYAEKPGKARVVAAATTQEEIAWHGGGAAIARRRSTRRSRSSSTSPSRRTIRTSRRRRSASTRWAAARSSAAAR